MWGVGELPKSHVNSVKSYQHTSITIQHRFSFALMWQEHSSCIPHKNRMGNSMGFYISSEYDRYDANKTLCISQWNYCYFHEVDRTINPKVSLCDWPGVKSLSILTQHRVFFATVFFLWIWILHHCRTAACTKSFSISLSPLQYCGLKDGDLKSDPARDKLALESSTQDHL